MNAKETSSINCRESLKGKDWEIKENWTNLITMSAERLCSINLIG